MSSTFLLEYCYFIFHIVSKETFVSKQPRWYQVRNTLRLSKLWAPDYFSNIYLKNLSKLRFLFSFVDLDNKISVLRKLELSRYYSASQHVPHFLSKHFHTLNILHVSHMDFEMLFPLLKMPCLLMSSFYDLICSYVTVWSLLRCITLQPRFPPVSTVLGMFKSTYLPFCVPAFQSDFEHWRTRRFCEVLEGWFRH